MSVLFLQAFLSKYSVWYWICWRQSIFLVELTLSNSIIGMLVGINIYFLFGDDWFFGFTAFGSLTFTWIYSSTLNKNHLHTRFIAWSSIMEVWLILEVRMSGPPLLQFWQLFSSWSLASPSTFLIYHFNLLVYTLKCNFVSPDFDYI